VTNILTALRSELTEGGERWGTGILAPLCEKHLAVASALTHDPTVATEIREICLDLEARLARGGPRDELGDELLAVGEDLSARLLASALREVGVPVTFVDSREVVRTDRRFGAAIPQTSEVRRLAAFHFTPLSEAGRVAVTQGFVGATEDGRTTTLGRGGSDFTATLLGSALDATEVRIWTDVDGIFSADPETVEGARILTEIGFEEAVELSHFGARVLHPGAAKHAVAGGLEVSIRNTFHPEAQGTVVLRDRLGTARVAAVVHKPRVVLVKVRALPSAVEYGFLARVFGVLARHAVPVDLVSTSHTSTAFTIDEVHELGPVIAELKEWAEVEVVSRLATITLVGHGLLREPGIVARVFSAVGSTAIHLVALASDVSLSFLVDAEEALGVVRRLHAELVAREEEEGG
jgi:aspartate kinase